MKESLSLNGMIAFGIIEPKSNPIAEFSRRRSQNRSRLDALLGGGAEILVSIVLGEAKEKKSVSAFMGNGRDSTFVASFEFSLLSNATRS